MRYVLLLLFLAACTPVPTGMNSSCIARSQDYSVRGHSLDGIINHMDNVTVLIGAHRCNPLHRGDIVLFSTSLRPNPLIKVVEGLPGDTWNVTNSSLLINDAPVYTANGTPYRVAIIDELLIRPVIGNFSTIPPRHYLVLSNNADRGLDSRQLGLVAEDEILGIAVKNGSRFE